MALNDEAMTRKISRRNFLGTTMALSVLPILKTRIDIPPRRFPIGLQLFTIRDAMEKDVRGTLRQVSEMGYEDLETYGFDPDKIGYYGMDADAFKQVLKENRLTTSSGHYDLFRYLRSSNDETLRYVDKCIQGAHKLGQRYITWPWLDPDSRTVESFKLLAKKLDMIGKHVVSNGLQFAYHNHDFEFIDHDGQNGYEIVMTETNPEFVKLQIDLYWVMHSSNLTPEELFKKQPGRFVMWHIKDMDKVSRDYTELGNGSIDYSKILPLTKLAGMEYFYLEQGGNFKNNSMESIRESIDFFNRSLHF